MAGEAKNAFSRGPDLYGSFRALALDNGLPDLRLWDGFFLGRASPIAQWVKSLHAVQEPQELQVQSRHWEDLLEEEMATYSS